MFPHRLLSCARRAVACDREELHSFGTALSAEILHPAVQKAFSTELLVEPTTSGPT
jgi:hypothetical protein